MKTLTKLLLLSLLFVPLFGAPASSQPAPTDAPPPQQAVGPCHRSASSITMAVTNIDEMKCQLAISVQALNSSQMQVLSLSARLEMLTNDLADARKQAATTAAAGSEKKP